MTLSTELELRTQIEVLKTDMGMVQRQLMDVQVQKRVAEDTMMKIIDKLIESAVRNDSNCC